MYSISGIRRRGAAASIAICAIYWLLQKYTPWTVALAQGGWGGWACKACIPVLVVAVLAWIGLRINYIRRKVKAADGLACLQCLYCLRGLEPCGKCPECGTPYDISVVAATWPRVLRNAGF